MRYVLARIDKNNRDEAYRFYVTDALKVIGGLNLRFYDIINVKEPVKKEETRTPEEIINRLKEKLNELI